jgi:hypothetical protein
MRPSLVSSLLLSTTLFAAMTVSSAARADKPYHAGDPIPDGYHVEENTHLGLIFGGATIFTVMYSFSAVAASRDPERRIMYAPVAGAFYAGITSFHGCGHGEFGGFGCLEGATMLFDAAAQTAGIAMAIAGTALRGDQFLVPNRKVHVGVTPMPGGGGFIATGTF